MPWVVRKGTYGDIRGMDHRADWFFGPGILDFLGGRRNALIPFILSLRDDDAREAVDAFLRNGMGQGLPGPPFYIAPYYLNIDDKDIRTLRSDVAEGRYFVAWAPLRFFEDLLHGDGTYKQLRRGDKRISLGTPIEGVEPKWQQGQIIQPLAAPKSKPKADELPDDAVFMGIVDDGIAFAHEHFRRGDVNDGTRVEWFWRQGEPVSEGVEFGLEIGKHDDPNTGDSGIDTLLQQCVVGGAVDEDMLYREAGLIDFSRPYHNSTTWRAAHGTFVLDVAAGADPKAVDVDNRPIIAVQLPATITANSAGADLTPHVLSAIHYILRRADELSGKDRKLPVVINFSYGIIAGPHDGTSELEDEIDALIRSRDGMLRVVMPAGNGHLSRCHAEVRFPANAQAVTLYVRVQPDDRTPSFLQIWVPHAGASLPAASRLRVSVETPDGAASVSLEENNNNMGVCFKNRHGDDICCLGYTFKAEVTQRGLFHLTLQPTSRLAPTPTAKDVDLVVTPGIWKITLENVLLAPDESVHVWIQRDENIYGYPNRARQAYFYHSCYMRFDSRGFEVEDDINPPQGPCEVTRKSLINPLATGAEVLVAGGFRRKSYELAPYSAGGPVMPTQGVSPDPRRYRKPDACFVSDDSKVHVGLLAAGTRSGSTIAFSGTSVAAPQLARWIADEMAAGRPGDRDAVRTCAQGVDPGNPPLPANRGGWGRIGKPPVVPAPRYWD